MKKNLQNGIIAALCLVIAASAALTLYTVRNREPASVYNPNVLLVTAPEQDSFEVHPEWTVPSVEEVDYGENLALEAEVREDSHTQVYHCRNVNDGDRFTYWEGKADAYPNTLTFDMGQATALSGARLLLNPRQLWSARTQEVEILAGNDPEKLEAVVPKQTLSFDPLTDNSVYIPFGATIEAQYVQFVFYSNSGAAGGQVAEIELYGPQA